MNISLIGSGNKKPFLYALTRVLSEMGSTIVITRNPQFLAAADDCETRFYLGNANFVVTYHEMDNVFDDADFDRSAYQYLVFDCDSSIPVSTDIIVHLITGNRREYESQCERLENFADIPHHSFVYDMLNYDPFKEEAKAKKAEYMDALKKAKRRGFSQKPEQPKELTVKRIPMLPSTLLTVNRIEENQKLTVFKDAKLNAAVATVLAQVLGLDYAKTLRLMTKEVAP